MSAFEQLPRWRVSEPGELAANPVFLELRSLLLAKPLAQLRIPSGLTAYPRSVYSEIIPIVPSHVSTNSGHRDTGSFVRRSPNACPPCAYKCISTGTPAFFSAR